MDMKIIKSEKRICSCCMEEHEVKTVLVMDQATFKNSTVDYEASYFFCELAEELYMDEQQMQDNDIRLKDAYRKKEGLLTSAQIGEIRAKYGISQSDLCLLLGWGGCRILGCRRPLKVGLLFPEHPAIHYERLDRSTAYIADSQCSCLAEKVLLAR